MLGWEITGVIYGLIWVGLSIRALIVEVDDDDIKNTVIARAMAVLLFTVWPVVYVTLVYRGYRAKRNDE